MPVPLYPTCLDVCGCMVALGTREGPVLLFDVGPRPSDDAPARSSREGLKLRVVAAAASTPSKFGGSTCRDDSSRDTCGGGSRDLPASPAGATAGIGAATSGSGVSEDGGNKTSSVSVTRVYGSLTDGTGPISSVILDRAKVIAAGRGSRRSGGGYVIRCGEEGHIRGLRIAGYVLVAAWGCC